MATFSSQRSSGDGGIGRLLNLLQQLDPMEHQRESDRRWEKMCHWLDEHPESKPKTMGDHMKLLNNFGFEVHYSLTPRQEKIEGGFDKFMKITGGSMSVTGGTYPMQDMTQPQRKCELCKQPALRRCAKCNAPYCCRECQLKDWKDHKKVCRAIQQAQQL